MTVEQKIPGCPFWRKAVEYNGYVLVLCGRKLNEEGPILSSNEVIEAGSTCQWWNNSRKRAWSEPAILELPRPLGELFGPEERVVAQSPGGMGIRQLEAIWEAEVEKFIERHSQSLAPPMF